MTDPHAPAGAHELGCALEPTGLWVRARIQQARRHMDDLLLSLEPLDPHRRGKLAAVLSRDFIQQCEAASGIVLDLDHLVGEHTLLLTLVVDPLLGLSGHIIGLDRGCFLKAWAGQDGTVQAALDAHGLWGRQRGLPVPHKLRRVVLIEPDDGAPHPIGGELARWFDQGILELIRLPVAYEESGSVSALHEAFGMAYDQFEWGTLDAVIVEPGAGFAFRALSDESLMRRIAVLPVPVLYRRAGVPTLLDGMAYRACDDAEEILAVLTQVLRAELRAGGQPRLEAIAREIGRPAAPDPEPVDPNSAMQGPLFD